MKTGPRFLGIEIGGTKLQLGLGPGDGRLVELVRRTIVPADGATGILAQIAGAARSLAGGGVDAVGIGFGGPVDARRGIVARSHQVAGWDGFGLADWVRETLGCPLVSIHNDADTAALAEARFGAGIGLSPVLYLTIGSGIGGGLIVDGRIYRGAGSGAVEIGHLIVDGPDSSERRTLEGVASGWSIGASGREAAGRGTGGLGDLRALAGGDVAGVTALTVAESARRDPDGPGARVLRRATSAMGAALAHAVTLLAPRRIILGGGVSLIEEDLWLDPIRKALDERVFPPFRGTFDLVTAALGEEVVVHGAIALARDAFDACPAL